MTESNGVSNFITWSDLGLVLNILVLLKLFNCDLNVAYVTLVVLWVTWTAKGLYDSGKPFNSIAITRPSLRLSFALLRAVIDFSALIR